MTRVPRTMREASGEFAAQVRRPGRYNLVHYSYSSMRKFASSLLAVLLLVSACRLVAQQPSAQAPAKPGREASQQSDADIRVDVKLVNVYVTVTDATGSPIGGLTKDNFILKEDDREQKISVFDKQSAVPISIALAIDTSGSTRHDLPLEQASAKRFAHAILRPVDALSLWSFNETVYDSTHGYTADLRRIDDAVDHIRLGAATALYDAICVASRSLDHRKGRKVLVLITDGDDTVSKFDYKQAVRAAQESEALVYSIIIVPIENSAGRDIGGEHALIQLSEDTGGKYYYATSSAQLDDVFRKISDELRTQYLLAYYPSQHASFNDFRKIEVKVTGTPDAGSYHVRHRAGYYTVKSEY